MRRSDFNGEYELKKLNLKLIPYNIIIAIISVVCVVTLALGTFWKFSISYQMSEDMMKALLQNAGDGEDMEEGAEDFFANIDFESIASDAKFQMGLTISPDSLFTSLKGDNTETVTTVLNTASSEILKNVDTIIKSMFSAGMKLAVAMAVEEINSAIEEEAEELAPEVANLDLSGVNDIVDEMLSENPDNEQIKTDLIDLVNTQIENADLTEEQKAQLIAESEISVGDFYDNIVEEYGDENGSIVPTDIAVSLLSDTLNLNVEENGDNSMEDLSMAVTEKIVSSMSEDTINRISLVYRGLAILLVVVMAAWALLAVKALLKIFFKNKGVGLGLARALGWIPYVLLVGFPMVMIMLIPKIIASVSYPEITEYAKYAEGFNLKFESLTYISALGTVALMFINWFGYKSTKKRIKKL